MTTSRFPPHPTPNCLLELDTPTPAPTRCMYNGSHALEERTKEKALGDGCDGLALLHNSGDALPFFSSESIRGSFSKSAFFASDVDRGRSETRMEKINSNSSPFLVLVCTTLTFWGDTVYRTVAENSTLSSSLPPPPSSPPCHEQTSSRGEPIQNHPRTREGPTPPPKKVLLSGRSFSNSKLPDEKGKQKSKFSSTAYTF